MNLAALLLADFNVYRMQTKHIQDLVLEKGFPIGMLKPTPERMKLLEEMVAWCRERQIEPRVWLYSLFRQRRWIYAPKFQAGHLMSKNHVAKFEKMRGLGFFRKRTAASKGEQSFDPNRDISATVEALKKRYAESQQVGRCLDEVLGRTLGFHPGSEVCRGCGVKGDCLVKLQSIMKFDVVALRRGTLTASEAEALQCQSA